MVMVECEKDEMRGRKETQHGKEFLVLQSFVPLERNRDPGLEGKGRKAMAFLLVACFLVWGTRMEIPKAYSVLYITMWKARILELMMRHGHLSLK